MGLERKQDGPVKADELVELMKSADASEVAAAFLDWLECTEELQKSSWQIVESEDKKVQDFLHAMEFEPNSKKRAIIGTKMHESRCARRVAKDIAKKLKPITDFVREANVRGTIKQLKKLRGDLKAAEDYVGAERVYKPRVKGGDDGNNN